MATEGKVSITKDAKNAAANLGIGLNTVISVAGGLLELRQRLREGDSMPVAIAKSVASTALYNIAPWLVGVQLTSMAGNFIGSGLPNASRTLKSMVQNSRATAFGGNVLRTQRGATMRQRGLDAIQRTAMNARVTLGNEAMNMFGR